MAVEFVIAPERVMVYGVLHTSRDRDKWRQQLL
jgi:hypothetical protein